MRKNLRTITMPRLSKNSFAIHLNQVNIPGYSSHQMTRSNFQMVASKEVSFARKNINLYSTKIMTEKYLFVFKRKFHRAFLSKYLILIVYCNSERKRSRERENVLED